jgi:hypothetical protein
MQTYDYHPPMPLPDPESPEQSLGDCAICMDAIVLDTSVRHRSKSSEGKGEIGTKGERVVPGGGLLNAVQMGVGASGTRKNYSLAPCHHLFVCHTVTWLLNVKLTWLFSTLSALNGYVQFLHQSPNFKLK